jgi:hypothetical protein
VPVLWLLTPPMGNITDMGLMTMNGIFQYSFVLASLWFLSKNKNWEFLVAILLAILATFSFGNGMLVFLSGYIVLLLPLRRNGLKISVWSLVMLLSVTGYFTNSTFHANPSSILLIFERPMESLGFFFAFFANILYPIVGKQLMPIIIVGILIISFYGYLIFFRWKYLKRYPVTVSAMVFILLTAIIITFSRIGLGIEEATADRYRLLTALFLALICISVFQGFQNIKKWVLLTLLIGSILFYTGRTMYGFYKLEKQKTLLSNGIKTFIDTGKCPKTLYPNPKKGSLMLSFSIRGNIYSPPNFKSKAGLSIEDGLEE